MAKSLDNARAAYFRSLSVLDPLRLHFWDSRGVTMTQLRVLHLIRLKGSPTTGELAEELHIRPATITGLADRLEEKGLIERLSDSSDRRVVRIRLAPEGSSLLEEASAAGRSFVDSILDRMQPDALKEFTRSVESFIQLAGQVQAEADLQTSKGRA